MKFEFHECDVLKYWYFDLAHGLYKKRWRARYGLWGHSLPTTGLESSDHIQTGKGEPDWERLETWIEEFRYDAINRGGPLRTGL